MVPIAHTHIHTGTLGSEWRCQQYTHAYTKEDPCCNTLQHAATHCNTLQHTATCCNMLQVPTVHTYIHTDTSGKWSGSLCVCVCVYVWSKWRCQQHTHTYTHAPQGNKVTPSGVCVYVWTKWSCSLGCLCVCVCVYQMKVPTAHTLSLSLSLFLSLTHAHAHTHTHLGEQIAPDEGTNNEKQDVANPFWRIVRAECA